MATKHTYKLRCGSTGIDEPVVRLCGDCLWIGGREHGIVGIIDNLRSLRRIHKRLGEIIRERGVFTEE
jgi:hypothetical protein